MMKKIVFVLYFPLLFVGAGAQQSLKKVSENYFRSPPFEREFNLVLKHLMNDPTLSNKNILKKTDSTLFFLEGDYSNHNPFFFKATRTRIICCNGNDLVIYLPAIYHLHITDHGGFH